MSFGNKTIVFRRLVPSGVADSRGNFTLVPQDTPAPGCRHRPLTFTETADLEFDVSTKPWKSTIPLKDYSPELIAIITAFEGNDVILVDGVQYQIIGGVRPHDDLASVPFKMTIISMRQQG